jgi:hypothetical protein
MPKLYQIELAACLPFLPTVKEIAMTVPRPRRLVALLLSVTVLAASYNSIPFQPALAAQITAARQDKQPVTNADIIRMIKSGLAETVVLSVIEANDSKFDVSVDALIGLKNAGISQKVIEAMLASESRRTAASRPQAAAPVIPGTPVPPQSPLRALLIKGQEKLPLTLNTTARAALVKSNENDLKGIAANQAIGAAIITGSLRAGAAIASATGAMSSLGIIGAAGSIVGGRFFRKKPTQTVVFAVAGHTSQAVLHSREPTFEVVYQDIPGVNPDDYEPILVRLIPTKDNYRIFSAVKIKDGKTVTPRPLVEQVPIRVMKLSRGQAQIAAAGPLEAGEYGLLLLPVERPQKSSGPDGAAFTQNEEAISLLVWDFSIAPEGSQVPVPSQAAPTVQMPQAVTINPGIASSASPAVPREVPAQPAVRDAPKGSVAFQTSAGYDVVYERILNVLKKEGYTLASASKEAGQITTELAIEHGYVDVGRAVVISLIKEEGGLTTVQVTAYKQGRKVGGQWREKVYTTGKAEMLAVQLRAALNGN